MLRLAMVAAAATVLIGTSQVAALSAAASPYAAPPAAAHAAAPVVATVPAAATAAMHGDTGSDAYKARVASDGVDGTITVTLDKARTGGTMAWALDGLRAGNVTIRMEGGTCEDPTHFVGSGWTRELVEGTDSRVHSLPDVSAESFAADIAAHRGVTATVRNNGTLIACVPFTDKV